MSSLSQHQKTQHLFRRLYECALCQTRIADWNLLGSHLRACSALRNNPAWKESFEVRLELPRKREEKAQRKEEEVDGGLRVDRECGGVFIQNPNSLTMQENQDKLHERCLNFLNQQQ